MINDFDIISVNSNITFDCGNCSMEVIVNNSYITFKATRVSKKGFIIRESDVVDRGGNYENIINFLNSHRESILLLIEKTRVKAIQRDLLSYNNDD